MWQPWRHPLVLLLAAAARHLRAGRAGHRGCARPPLCAAEGESPHPDVEPRHAADSALQQTDAALAAYCCEHHVCM